jgi:ABC-2 type transport system ATP-binding protein
VSELLERFGLADAGDRIVKTYSGGMQRRLDVALGLIHEPQVLVLDEPTTGLDPEVRAGMWKEISRLASERGITIFLTTHYLEEADALTQRLVIVDRGRIVASGTADELKGELKGDSIHVELGEPQTDGRVTTALETIGDIREVQVEGNSLRARTDDGARAVPVVLQALEAHGVAVASVTVSRPSLDDVYLRHTGRSFTEAETVAAAEQQQRHERQEARR